MCPLWSQTNVEIRFQPDSILYAYQLNDNPVELYSAVLQNIAIVNPGNQKVKLNRLTIAAFKDSLEIQKVSIYENQLVENAQSNFEKQTTDRLNLFEFKLQRNVYLQGVQFAANTSLNKNEAIVISSTPLLYNGLPDYLVVTAYYTHSGSNQGSTAKRIEIDTYAHQTPIISH